VFAVVVVEVEERVGMEEGACALSAARMWAGVTVDIVVLVSCFELEARSMAPLRTSNSDLTSPVCDATFFVRSVNVGNGKTSSFPPILTLTLKKRSKPRT
jgi:hypothetical protein